MGRPNVLTKPVRIALRLEADDLEKVEAIAQRKGVSISEVVRDAIASLAEPTKRRPKRRRS